MKFKIVLIFFLLISCSSFDEAGKALRNEKLKSTDEFLIEKKRASYHPPRHEWTAETQYQKKSQKK